MIYIYILYTLYIYISCTYIIYHHVCPYCEWFCSEIPMFSGASTCFNLIDPRGVSRTATKPSPGSKVPEVDGLEWENHRKTIGKP